MQDKQYYTINEAGEALGVNPMTIRRRIQSGKIRAEMIDGKTGKQYRISSEELFAKNAPLIIQDVVEFKNPVRIDQLQNLLELAINNNLKPVLQAQNEFIREQSEAIEELTREVESLKNSIVKEKSWFQKIFGK